MEKALGATDFLRSHRAQRMNNILFPLVLRCKLATFSSCSSGNKKASKLQKQQGKMAKSEKRPEKVKRVEKVGKFAGKKKT